MKYVLSCGGTGGHIYPAIAIADKIKEKDPDAEILFIGTKKGMENRLVPAAGYEIKGIDARGFDRKHFLNNLKTVQTFLEGNQEVYHILKDYAPDIAIGTGGYVTGSVIAVAHTLHIKTYIHEQNAVPGVANKFLSGFVDKVFTSFDGTQKRFRRPKRVVLTGNPIRSGFTYLDKDECRQALGIGKDDKMVLVFGGSLGAQVINRETIGLAEKIGGKGIKLFFVTGRRYYGEVTEALEGKTIPELTLISYADNMPELMCAADLVVSRAGAIAVSEITACGKPSVLVPSPNVTNNHQYYNAKAVADAGAAVLVQERNLPQGKNALADIVLELAADAKKLAEMAENAKKTGRTDASDVIYSNLDM